MVARRALQIVTGLLLGLALVAVVVLLTPPPMTQVDWAGASPPPAPYPAPELELTDPDGNRVNLASFRGRTTVVFFGYTNCPDVCPATLLNLSGALDRLRPREADRLQVVFVSLDPERDTPERMRSWLRNFHPSIVGLTGDRDEVWSQAARWGVHAAITPVTPTAPPTSGADDPHAGHAAPDASADDPPAAHAHAPGPWGLPDGLDALVPAGAPGAYWVDHSTRSFVVDRQGRIVLFLAPFQGAEAMTEDLRRVLR
jgi:protein SCO1